MHDRRFDGGFATASLHDRAVTVVGLDFDVRLSGPRPAHFSHTFILRLQAALRHTSVSRDSP